MHITSQVSGELADGKGPIDVLRATLPAGTLSGAPKVRAMEIIDELEPTKRGVYGGVVGYIDFSGNVDTAIAIRTMVVTPDGRASVQAGAGIVADSDPEREDEECAHKAGALLVAVTAARRMGAGAGAGAGSVTPIALDAETAALRARRRRVPRSPGRVGRARARRGGLPAGPAEPGRGSPGRRRVGRRPPARARREALGPAPGDPYRRAGLRARRRRRLRPGGGGTAPPLLVALQGRDGAAGLALSVVARGRRRGGGSGPAGGAGRAGRAGAALCLERLDGGRPAGPRGRGARRRRVGPPPRHRGVRCRGRGGLPHRLGDTGHGHRADGQDHRGRGRAWWRGRSASPRAATRGRSWWRASTPGAPTWLVAWSGWWRRRGRPRTSRSRRA